MSKLLGIGALLASCTLMLTSVDAQEGEKDKGKFKGKGDPAKRAEAIFKKLDANGDNRLSKDEFLKMADRAKDADKGAKLKELLTRAYEKADPDLKGLTMDQFKEMQATLRDKVKDRKKKNATDQ